MLILWTWAWIIFAGASVWRNTRDDVSTPRHSDTQPGFHVKYVSWNKPVTYIAKVPWTYVAGLWLTCAFVYRRYYFTHTPVSGPKYKLSTTLCPVFALQSWRGQAWAVVAEVARFGWSLVNMYLRLLQVLVFRFACSAPRYFNCLLLRHAAVRLLVKV